MRNYIYTNLISSVSFSVCKTCTYTCSPCVHKVEFWRINVGSFYCVSRMYKPHLRFFFLFCIWCENLSGIKNNRLYLAMQFNCTINAWVLLVCGNALLAEEKAWTFSWWLRFYFPVTATREMWVQTRPWRGEFCISQYLLLAWLFVRTLTIVEDSLSYSNIMCTHKGG